MAFIGEDCGVVHITFVNKFYAKVIWQSGEGLLFVYKMRSASYSIGELDIAEHLKHGYNCSIGELAIGELLKHGYFILSENS